MRHRNSGRQLSRNSSHRHALLRNMATSLLRHETIRTTVPKAKELRRVVEPLITLAKIDSLAKRRLAYLAAARCRGRGEAVCRSGAALQGAGRRLHADSQDGAASGRCGRYGADAAGGMRLGRRLRRPMTRRPPRRRRNPTRNPKRPRLLRKRRRHPSAARPRPPPKPRRAGSRAPRPRTSAASNSGASARRSRRELGERVPGHVFRLRGSGRRHCPRCECRRTGAALRPSRQSMCARRASRVRGPQQRIDQIDAGLDRNHHPRLEHARQAQIGVAFRALALAAL